MMGIREFDAFATFPKLHPVKDFRILRFEIQFGGRDLHNLRKKPRALSKYQRFLTHVGRPESLSHWELKNLASRQHLHIVAPWNPGFLFHDSIIRGAGRRTSLGQSDL